MSRATPKGSTALSPKTLQPHTATAAPPIPPSVQAPRMLELVAAFICLTTLLTYVGFRFIGLPPTIGVMPNLSEVTGIYVATPHVCLRARCNCAGIQASAASPVGGAASSYA